jgi:hypothetical protein
MQWLEQKRSWRFTIVVYTFTIKGAPLHIGKIYGRAIADPAVKKLL